MLLERILNLITPMLAFTLLGLMIYLPSGLNEIPSKTTSQLDNNYLPADLNNTRNFKEVDNTLEPDQKECLRHVLGEQRYQQLLDGANEEPSELENAGRRCLWH